MDYPLSPNWSPTVFETLSVPGLVSSHVQAEEPLLHFLLLFHNTTIKSLCVVCKWKAFNVKQRDEMCILHQQ